jgi:hypothetical protein
MAFKFEYLSEFEFMFENRSGFESGNQVSSFNEKNMGKKILCKCILNLNKSTIS